MSIAKPIRQLLQMLVLLHVTILGPFLVFHFCQMPWAAVLGLLAIPISWFLAGTFNVFVIDGFDLWLRKRSRDTLWLWTDEGKQWLKTEEGQRWLSTARGSEWAQNYGKNIDSGPSSPRGW